MRPSAFLTLFFFVSAAVAQNHPDYETFDILSAASESHSRDTTWRPADGIVMEVSGLEFTSDGRLAVAVRKGEIWFLDGVYGDDPAAIQYHLFASGLHEPLGLFRDFDSYLVAQRTEVTSIRDVDDDDVADEFLTAASGWNVSGNYHAYIYGPKRDGDGRLWITTNLDIGDDAENDGAWRGWGMTMNSDGSITPVAAGMRSPCGLGANREGDMFFTDQQGNWIPATPVHHLREGVFYGNPDGIASQDLPGSPLKLSSELPVGELYPKAVKMLPELVAPAVWLPYDKMGRSATDLVLCDQNGRFGPFDGQLLVGEFTNAAINRVFLEKVDGQYQGACFPFLSGFPAAVFRMTFGEDGSLFVGMTNRGWSSLGTRSYGLQRVRLKKGATLFAIQEMRAKPDGFELVFTQPVDPRLASDPDSYSLESYTYKYSSSYGGDELARKKLTVMSATVSDSDRSVRIKVDGLREGYVHELRAKGVTTGEGKKLLHPVAYYTLNRLPR